MDKEKQLEQRIEQYRELASTDKGIDAAALMIGLLQNQNQNFLSVSEKRWAYLISLGLPPLGLVFALKFYLSGKDDGKQAAYACLALTAISVIIFWLIIKSLGGTATPSTVRQLEQIQPEQVQELVQ